MRDVKLGEPEIIDAGVDLNSYGSFGTAILIAESERGTAVPVGLAASLDEAREIATDDLRRASGYPPRAYKMWVHGRRGHRVAAEFPVVDVASSPTTEDSRQRAAQRVGVKLDTAEFDDPGFAAFRAFAGIEAVQIGEAAGGGNPEYLYVGPRAAIEAMMLSFFASGDEETDAEAFGLIEEVTPLEVR